MEDLEERRQRFLKQVSHQEEAEHRQQALQVQERIDSSRQHIEELLNDQRVLGKSGLALNPFSPYYQALERHATSLGPLSLYRLLLIVMVAATPIAFLLSPVAGGSWFSLMAVFGLVLCYVPTVAIGLGNRGEALKRVEHKLQEAQLAQREL